MPRWLRDAPWLTPARARAGCLAIAWIAATLASLSLLVFCRPLAAGAKPMALDFDAFWAAARLAVAGHAPAAYDNAAIEAVERAATDMPPGYLAFYYPPTFLLACLPLGLAGYATSLAAFLLAQFALLVILLRCILKPRWALLPILVWPGFLMNALSGQNGGLSAACFAGAMLTLERRPALAGICLGALACKPQLAPCVPVALLAARRWRALVWCGATASALALASWLAFGPAAWHGFAANAPNARIDLETLAFKWPKMQSAFAAIRLAGGAAGGVLGSVAFAYFVQGAVSLTALAGVAWVACSRAGARAEMAALAVGCLLFTPFLYDYDLTVVAVPLAWLAAAAQAGWRPGEKILAALLFVMPLTLRAFGMGAGLLIGPPLLLWFLAAIVTRARTREPSLAILPAAASA